MDKEERNRWMMTAAICSLALVGFVLALVLMSQPRVFSLDGQPPVFVVREDPTAETLGDLLGHTMLLAGSLGLMAWGGFVLPDKDSRTIGLGMWLCSFLGLYFALTSGRDALTLSELRVSPAGQSVACSGYIFGSRFWTNSTLYSQIKSVSFPLGLGDRRGVLVDTTTGPLCSLHHRTLSREDAKTLATRLTAELGSKVQAP